MTKRLTVISALVFTAACMSGCGTLGGAESGQSTEPVQIDSVTFEMAAQANSRRPARVGLAQFENPNLAARLVEISAADWFGEKGNKFRAAHPNAYYDDWELVPGLVTGPFALEVDEYVSAVLFCDTDANTPPLRIQEDGDLAVHIEPGGCEVHPIE